MKRILFLFLLCLSNTLHSSFYLAMSPEVDDLPVFPTLFLKKIYEDEHKKIQYNPWVLHVHSKHEVYSLVHMLTVLRDCPVNPWFIKSITEADKKGLLENSIKDKEQIIIEFPEETKIEKLFNEFDKYFKKNPQVTWRQFCILHNGFEGVIDKNNDLIINVLRGDR